jgi:hypothetical protein
MHGHLRRESSRLPMSRRVTVGAVEHRVILQFVEVEEGGGLSVLGGLCIEGEIDDWISADKLSLCIFVV